MIMQARFVFLVLPSRTRPGVIDYFAYRAADCDAHGHPDPTRPCGYGTSVDAALQSLII